jgi:hypothetical protein
VSDFFVLHFLLMIHTDLDLHGVKNDSAWCSHHNKCRNDTVVERIHDRIAKVSKRTAYKLYNAFDRYAEFF